MKFLERYTDSERMTHWVVAIAFVLAGLSGLAFFHPAFYFLTNLFGGGPWTRILHPFIGVVMAVFFFRMARQQWEANKPADGDREWNAKARDLFMGQHVDMPPAGKFNAGQKRLFRLLVGSTAVMLVTGLVIWRPWFAPLFPVVLLRAAVLLHAAAGAIMILTIAAHVYTAIWVPGTIRAMTRGTVSESWAKMHHALWHREMTQGK